MRQIAEKSKIELPSGGGAQGSAVAFSHVLLYNRRCQQIVPMQTVRRSFGSH
jgi:hypothetical protein